MSKNWFHVSNRFTTTRYFFTWHYGFDIFTQEAARAREEGERALADSKRLEMDQGTRLSSIQGQLQALRAKEKQIAQVKKIVVVFAQTKSQV